MTDPKKATRSGKERRRSARVSDYVALTVSGVDAEGQAFEEQTATLDFSFHGCRFFSRYRVEESTWLMLELDSRKAGTAPVRIRARAAWCRASRRLKGLFQIGVELEQPGNLWGVAAPPADWAHTSRTEDAASLEFQRELERLLELAAKGNYYELLGVSALTSKPDIKRRYYLLAKKFHPDLHTGRPEWADSLRQLMEALALAYRTLTEEKLRRDYDQRLAKTGAFALGQQKSEVQKLAEEYFARAQECLRASNLAGSITWLRRCVEADPNSSKLHALLARSLAALDRYRREAIEHFQKAIELDPWNLTAYFHLAQLYVEMQLPWRALPLYQKVLEMDPGNAKAKEQLQRLGSAKGAQGEPKGGVLDRFLTRNSK